MKITLYSIVTLVVFRVVCVSQTVDRSQEVRTGTRYANTLAVFHEPEIFPHANADTETYRLLVTATFYHPLVVRIERSGNSYLLEAKWLSGQVGYGWGKLEGQKTRQITQREWRTLNDLLNRSSFWTLPNEDKEPEPNEKGEMTACLDGVGWFLEGSARSKYHVVDRYCPDSDAFKAVGLYMVKLARLNIGLRLK